LTGSTARKSGKEAAAASKEAAQTQADYMTEALDYLKEREEVPQQYRELALERLGDIYGTERTPAGLMTQEERIAAAKESPLYGAIMGTQEAGEEAMLRSAGATGMLRSGNIQEALAESAQDLESRALLESYNEQLRQEQYEQQLGQYGEQMELAGIQAMMGAPSLAPQIAQQTTGIGKTLAQGQVAGAQAKAGGIAASGAQMMELANLGLTAGMAFSDIRLKDNIEHIGTENGYNKYRWRWNKAAEKLNLIGEDEGFMAHELAVNELGHSDGYLQIRV